MASEVIRFPINPGESQEINSSLLRLTANDVLTVEEAYTHREGSADPHLCIWIRIERTGLSL